MTPGISLKRCSMPQKHPPAKVAFSMSSPLMRPARALRWTVRFTRSGYHYCAQNRRSVTIWRLTMNAPGTPPPKRRWLQMVTVDIAPLRRHRDFRLLFVGQLVSFFGTMITSVAVPYQVYQLSHSVLFVGMLGLAELAAILIFALLGGALADAADRRLMVLLTEAGLMAGSLLLAGNAALTHPMLWLIFAVVLLG